MSPARFRLALAELEPGEVAPGEVAPVVVADDEHAAENVVALLQVLLDERDARPSLAAAVVSGAAVKGTGAAALILAWTDLGPPPAVIDQLDPGDVLLLCPEHADADEDADDDEGAGP